MGSQPIRGSNPATHAHPLPPDWVATPCNVKYIILYFITNSII